MIKKEGFTLIELLVVIAILGLVSTIAVSVLSSARASARDAKIRADLVQLSKALELYRNTNGYLPDIGNGNGGKPWQGVITSDLDAADWDAFLNIELPQTPTPPGNGTFLDNNAHNTLSPFDTTRYIYMEPGAQANGSLVHVLNPTTLQSGVLLAPIEKPKSSPPDCNGTSGSGWSGAPSQSTNCQDLEVGCRLNSVSKWGVDTVWICIRI